MSHFKAKMHQIPFLASVRLSVRMEFDTADVNLSVTLSPLRSLWG